MGNSYGKKDKSLFGTYRKNVSNLLKAESKIRKMKIENMDFREVIDKYNDPDTFFTWTLHIPERTGMCTIFLKVISWS